MSRPRSDGQSTRAPNRRKLTELYVKKARSEGEAINIWDSHQHGLVLRVQPSGHKAFKAVYRRQKRPRWYHIGSADAVGLHDARRIAARIMLAAAEGGDPAAERRAERGSGTFAELAKRYVEEHAKKKNKSWRQAEALVANHLLPRWGNLQVTAIARSDVKTVVRALSDRPIVANQVLASASALFAWAVREEIVAANPCTGVERNSAKSRERILSDSEIALFWSEFADSGIAGLALKVLLLTGQRPGEVAHMRREHLVDGWWEMPGEPVPALGWPGTKNGQTHRVWLSQAVKSVIAELGCDEDTTGFVFPSPKRGNSVYGLPETMREICSRLKVSPVKPHDLRRTHGSTVTRLGFGRDAMNRIQNHREGGVTDTYDRHHYSDENVRIMEAVASSIVAVAEGRRQVGNVVKIK